MYLLYSDVYVKTSHLSIHFYTCSVQQFGISVNKRLKNFKSKQNSFPSFNLCNEKLLKWMKIWHGYSKRGDCNNSNSNRTLSLWNCKRNAYFCSSHASKVYDKKTCWKDQLDYCVSVNRYCMCGILAVMIHRCHVPNTPRWHAIQRPE